MYFDNLSLTPQQRRQLELDLNDLYDDYVDTLDRLQKEAANSVSGLVWDGESQELVKEEINRYADAANKLAADYYQHVRDTWLQYVDCDMPEYDPPDITADRAVWQIEGGFNNTSFMGLHYKDVVPDENGVLHNAAGVSIDDLWPSFGTDETKAYHYASEIVRVVARLTTQRAAIVDPTQPKYARVPAGPYTCAFCVMCASRGFAYWDEDTAGKFKPFHKNDDCRIIPSWGAARLRHYDQQYYMSMYEAAAKKAPGTSANEICAEMRRLYPDKLTDGVFKDSDKFTKDNSLRYGRWRASRAQAMKAHTALHPPTDLIPPRVPAEAPEWPEDLPVMRAKEWNHILYGLDKGGAHLHGYGWQRERSYEFPESWGPDEIRQAGIQVLRMPGNMENIGKLLADGHRRGSVKGTMDGVVVRVSFSKAGNSKPRVTSIMPVIGGE